MLDQVRLTTLPNGTRIITSPQPDAESAAVGIWIGVGGRYESAALTGASHFIEHMLFKGTRRRSARAISQAIEGRGGYLNAYTQEDGTCYYARLPHEFWHEALDVLADMYLEPRLTPADLARERDVIIEELRMYRDQPQHVVQEQFTEAVWPGHALGRPLAGTERSLKAMTRDRLDAFRRAHYTPAATVFAFAGRITHDACVEQVTRLVGQRPAGRSPTPKAFPARLPQERIRLVRREIEQVHAVIGFRTFGRHDPRRFALRVLNGALGENMSSRLFQIVREKHGLAYSVQSSYQLLGDTGAVTVSAGLDRARADQALRLVASEIDRIRRKPMGPAELRRTRDYLLGSFRLGLEGASSQMTWAGEGLLQYGKFISPDAVIAKLKAITADDVQCVAQQILDPRRLTVALVVPQDHPLDEAGWLKTLALI
jgi:predicted Zn-dependent peptidase